ncbi:unnamed protein product [Nippostrongylus brasiliensis]|uniref:Ubiquitin carboxyl-terminal hydrolase n=1 Tax=Nippostrongylus brasiliensis TaxID=27835 RepID=A0A0N4Y241_NIPBR|nr:unnamed protein product [Nippostrongylus brasiliensis]
MPDTTDEHLAPDDTAVIETVNYLLDHLPTSPEAEDAPNTNVDSARTASPSGGEPPPEETRDETEMANSSPTVDTGPSVDDPDTFKVKSIQFNSAKVSIVTQNANGPCPLIALVNVLALKGRIVLRCVLQIADVLLQMRPVNMSSHVESNYNRNLDDVINLLPDLGPLSLFDLLRVNLYHGWLPDPQFVEIQNAIGDLTYNQLVERICDDNSVNRLLLQEFLLENVTQLTYHGLVGLMEAMRDGELAVLFRNNHFHTIHKRKDLLFLLVSDSGYVSEPSIVWESFNNVDGSSIFLASDFTVGSPRATTTQQTEQAVSTDAE